MKIVKLRSERACRLWEFFRDNLPASLRAVKETDGYGGIWAITVKERSFGSYIPFSSHVAIVGEETVELRQPEYFSDFEQLIARYEAQTGREVVFKYWES